LAWLVLGAGSVLAQGTAAAPGAFDYYVLALSWSPQYCATATNNADRSQCSVPHGFVVHGLWPQYRAAACRWAARRPAGCRVRPSGATWT
jgi:ribonuclease T2